MGQPSFEAVRLLQIMREMWTCDSCLINSKFIKDFSFVGLIISAQMFLCKSVIYKRICRLLTDCYREDVVAYEYIRFGLVLM